MGHDIIAYQKSIEIAYLRYHGGAINAKNPYNCLNAQVHNLGNNGSNNIVTYTNQEIKTALKKAKLLKDSRLIEFFVKLENIKNDVKIMWG
jgi:hypothetical protein